MAGTAQPVGEKNQIMYASHVMAQEKLGVSQHTFAKTTSILGINQKYCFFYFC